MPPAPRTETNTIERLLDYIALGLLVAGPSHGYELYQDFVEHFGAVWQAGRSKFYATLADLQAVGYLDATTEPQEGRPPRKVYHLTEAGRAAFDRWLAEPVQAPRDVRVAIPVKLRFFDMLAIRGADKLLNAQIASCQARLDREARRPEAGRPAEDDRFEDVLHEFRRRQLRAMIDWLNYCKARFEQAASA